MDRMEHMQFYSIFLLPLISISKSIRKIYASIGNWTQERITEWIFSHRNFKSRHGV